MSHRHQPDWNCPTCGHLVFGSKSSCFKCGTFKPSSTHPSAAQAATPGGRRPDWPCPGCNALVFGSKDKCFKCGSFRPPGTPPPAPTGNMAPPSTFSNDWICPACSASVFGSKAACFKCSTPRPATGTAPVVSVAIASSKPRFPDWNCACGKLVFGSRAGCFGCGRPNPGLATPHASATVDADSLRRMQEDLKAKEDALLLQTASANSNLRRAMAPPPPYWDLSVSGTTTFPAPGSFRVLLESTPETAALQDLMRATIAGRTSASALPMVLRAWRVQNDNLWLKYCMNRDLMKDALAESPVDGPSSLFTLIDAEEATSGRGVAQKRFLTSETNEHYLWHATGANAVSIICEEGFDERVCALSGLFGAGVYFAELASKSFGYMPEGPCLDGAHQQTVGYMFLARVSMGRYHSAENTTMSNIRRAPNGCDSVLGVPHSGAPREFIVYDRRQTYPEFLLEIKR